MSNPLELQYINRDCDGPDSDGTLAGESISLEALLANPDVASYLAADFDENTVLRTGTFPWPASANIPVLDSCLGAFPAESRGNSLGDAETEVRLVLPRDINPNPEYGYSLADAETEGRLVLQRGTDPNPEDGFRTPVRHAHHEQDGFRATPLKPAIYCHSSDLLFCPCLGNVICSLEPELLVQVARGLLDSRKRPLSQTDSKGDAFTCWTMHFSYCPKILAKSSEIHSIISYW
jgi:hypothetical protein